MVEKKVIEIQIATAAWATAGWTAACSSGEIHEALCTVTETSSVQAPVVATDHAVARANAPTHNVTNPAAALSRTVALGKGLGSLAHVSLTFVNTGQQRGKCRVEAAAGQKPLNSEYEFDFELDPGESKAVHLVFLNKA